MKYFIVLFMVLLLLAFACEEKGTNPLEANYVIPDSNISYYDHLEPMFNGKCGLGTGCHYDRQDIIISDKNSFMNYMISDIGDRLVNLERWNNPIRQPLYLIVTEGYYDIERMPPFWDSREWLNKNQIDGIEQWIREGCND